MMKMLTIGLNVFREAIRDRILYNLLFFAMMMIACAALLSTLTVGERTKIIIDIGMASINFFGVLIAIFLGISLVSKEIDKRTIYTILSKPVSRPQFLLGKYLGLSITLLVNTIIMTGVFSVTLWYVGERFSANIFMPIGMIYLELMVMTAVGLFFSTFTTVTSSAIFTIAVYVIGHLSGDLREMAKRVPEVSKIILDFIYYLLPNLENFNFKGYASYMNSVPYPLLGFSMLYGIIYIFFLLGFSILIFNSREFK
jgi:ABC-type transport system involved in multi-copper enzyme maturation permease subunit